MANKPAPLVSSSQCPSPCPDSAQQTLRNHPRFRFRTLHRPLRPGHQHTGSTPRADRNLSISFHFLSPHPQPNHIISQQSPLNDLCLCFVPNNPSSFGNLNNLLRFTSCHFLLKILQRLPTTPRKNPNFFPQCVNHKQHCPHEDTGDGQRRP